MVKAYLRYAQTRAWGVVASGGCAFDSTGRLLASACLESVRVWSLRQGAEVQALSSSPAGPGAATPPQVCVLERAPVGNRLAAGYSDGSLRVWNLSSGECEVTLHGHKSAVSSLRFNRSGSLLASGGRDTDVVVWDVVGESGLFRLRGHRDEVTDLAFVSRGNRLISCSKDTHLRVWDLDTQHCSQTVVGHRAAVWALDLDVAERRLVTGCADAQLRVFALQDDEEGGVDEEGGTLLAPLGSLARPGTDRVCALRFDPTGAYLAVAPAGRLVELWSVHSKEEAARRLRRRRKRKREKGAAAAAATEEDSQEETLPTATDEFSLRATLPLKHKALALAFSPKPGRGSFATLAITLASNCAETYDLVDGEADAPAMPQKAAEVSMAGHRADVRAIALADDDAMLVSTSHAGAKIWNPQTGACLRSIPCGYGLCCAFAPGSRTALVGTKQGRVEFVDVAAAQLSRSLEAHAGPVWSLALLPGGKGFCTGGGDKDVKFWEFSMAAADAVAGTSQEAPSDAPRSLSARHARTLRLTDDVLCVRFSADGRYLLVALLDATVKVFFADTLKFFLSLYGHKLPVLCLDCSSDGALVATGSADKNIKLWGLDFGDCHRSIRAHDDSVTCLAFVPHTHYLFSASKDRSIRYWDGDTFEPLLQLHGHAAEVWGLAVSQQGDFLVTAGHDRSLRRWERTEEPFFVEEERERRLESLFEQGLEDTAERPLQQPGADTLDAAAQPPDEGTVGLAGRRTVATLGAAESIVDALEMAAAEVARQAEHDADVSKARAVGGTGGPPFACNPLLLGLGPSAYVLRALGGVRTADLEHALLLLPFASALQLLAYLPEWLQRGETRSELACTVAVFLLRLHQAQLAGTPGARATLLRLRGTLRPRLQGLKVTMGSNLAAVEILQRFYCV